MAVTMKDIPTIINDLKKRKPSTLAKDSDRPLSPKEAIMQLAPTLLKKKEEGFTTAELVSFLATHKIAVKPHNLTRYLREYQTARLEDCSDQPVFCTAPKPKPLSAE
ncbi:hypothetical protein LJB99_02520 [Deltaproteobacteria bacterium OttesenSCG-928-K17]|nr:hypothetical protein [Deltaproteobacteria bacterium OttesenSCG-928-K17]